MNTPQEVELRAVQDTRALHAFAGPYSSVGAGGRTPRAAGAPHGPGDGAGGPVDPSREEGVATKTRPKVTRPDRYKVMLYNDDYTPMEFVVSILEEIFGKSPAAATQIMLQIHRSGMGVAGVYVLQVSETKVSLVHRAAEERGYPLRAGVEKE